MINHKIIKSRVLFFLLPVLLIVGLVAGTFMLPAKLGATSYILPTLKATITSPGNNQTLNVGTTFDVIAMITYISGNMDVTDVKAIISVSGPAALLDPATQDVASIGLIEYNYPPATWKVQCTGPGTVTITVTPSARLEVAKNTDTTFLAWDSPLHFVGFGAGAMLDNTNSTIFHSGAIPSDVIPQANLISDTIYVKQKGKSNNDNSVSPSVSAPGYGYTYSPANVMITTLNIQPNNVAANQAVTIYANVVNRGDSDGAYTATLKVNNEVVEVKQGKIGGNIARPIEFTVARSTPGVYTIDVNGRQAVFTVEKSGQASSPVNGSIIFLGLLSVLFIATLVVFIRHFTAR